MLGTGNTHLQNLVSLLHLLFFLHFLVVSGIFYMPMALLCFNECYVTTLNCNMGFVFNFLFFFCHPKNCAKLL